MTDGTAPTPEERLVALEARCGELEAMAGEVAYLDGVVADLRRHSGLLPLAGEAVGLAPALPAPAGPASSPRGPGPGDPSDGVDPINGVVLVGVRGVDHGAPQLAHRTPTAWSGRSPRWRWRAWRDLDGWVRWLIGAYLLDGANEGWAAWWSCRGAVEELVALREWHRELVDIEVATVAPDAQLTPAQLVNLERDASAARRDRGRDWVAWHEAVECVATRVAGRDARELLGRQRGLAAPATASRVEQAAVQLREGFVVYLAELEGSGEVTRPPQNALNTI